MGVWHCCLVLLFVQIYLNVTPPILPYKHVAFNLGLIVAV